MTIIIFAVCPLVAGFLAQLWKGRTGVVWFFFVLILQFVVLLLSAALLTPEMWARDGAALALSIASAAIGGGVGVIIVASLPRHHRAAG